MIDFITWLFMTLSQLGNNELLIFVILLLLCGAAILLLFLLIVRRSAEGPSNRVLRKAMREVGTNKSFRVDEKGKIIDLTIDQKEDRGSRGDVT